MHKRTQILLTILQMLSSIKGSDITTDAKRVVCYYGGLTSKQMKILHPEDIDASVCTHIVYVHGGINTELQEIYITPSSESQPTGGENYIERLVKLKEANPNLKLLLFVSPEQIPWVLETAERRTKIIQSAVSLLNATKFDGLDFPTSPVPAEMEAVSHFYCEMQAAFENYGYILSTLVSGKPEPTTQEPVVERMSRCCSYIAVVTIGDWFTEVNTTRLLAPINLTRMAMETYIEKGFPANKLLISVPAFGMMVNLTDPKQTGLGASIDGPGNDITQYSEGYTIFYSMLSKRLNDTTEGWTVARDNKTNSPYAYSKTGKWVSYEDPISAAIKARYVLEKNLGGALIIALDLEDFDGMTGKTFPIIRAVIDTFKQGVRSSNASP